MKGRKGSALVAVLITFTVLSILAAAIIALVQSRLNLTVSYENYNGALYAAQAGIEEMKLNIKNRIPECKSYVENRIREYISSPDFDESFDLEVLSNSLGMEFFNRYFTSNSFERDLVEKNAAYSVKPSVDSNFIIISSTGVYGAGTSKTSRTIIAKIRLDYVDTRFTLDNGQSSPLAKFPLIIQQYPSELFSLRANCRDFKVYGPVYLPGGVHDIDHLGNSDFMFHDGLTVDDNLLLAGDQNRTCVSNGMKVNGNLEFGTGKHNMELIVENGDLVVNGDIYINGRQNVIKVLNGDIKCNGNIIIADKAGAEFYAGRDVHLTGSIVNNDGKHSSITIRGSVFSDYGGDIIPEEFSFGDISVFETKAGVIKTNSITQDYGSINNPVVIFYDGDITIDLSSQNEINIYGLVYATGRINIVGLTSNSKQLNITGNLISGKKINLDGGNGLVTVKYDNSLIGRIDGSITDYFGGIGYVDVPVVNSFSITSWDE